MPLTKKARSADSFQVLASWLQQTSHFVEGKQLSSGSRRALSQRYLKTAEDLLKLQREASLKEDTLQFTESAAASLLNNKALRRLYLPHSPNTDSSSEGSSLLLHPGVETLLVEYYQLLKSTPENVSSVIGTRYRPSVIMSVWNVVTKELPSSWGLGAVMEKLDKGLDAIARKSVSGIFVLLLVWLQVLRLFIVYGVPSTLSFLFFILGLSILNRSQEKLNEATTADKRQRLYLKSVKILKGTTSFSSDARTYLKCTELGRAAKSVSSVKWPANLPRPAEHQRQPSSVSTPSSTKTADASPGRRIDVLESLHKDVEEIHFAVMGGASPTPFNSPQSPNAEYIISVIQNLCQVIGVEPLGHSEQDLATVRAKITELRTAVGI